MTRDISILMDTNGELRSELLDIDTFRSKDYIGFWDPDKMVFFPSSSRTFTPKQLSTLAIFIDEIASKG